jgi:hypothetical protein
MALQHAFPAQANRDRNFLAACNQMCDAEARVRQPVCINLWALFACVSNVELMKL